MIIQPCASRRERHAGLISMVSNLLAVAMAVAVACGRGAGRGSGREPWRRAAFPTSASDARGCRARR